MGDWVVVKISGSLVYPPRGDYYRMLLSTLRRCSSSRRMVVVVGGGPLARDAIKALRAAGLHSRSLLDLAGIAATRFNGRLLSLALYPVSPPRTAETLDELIEMAASYRVVFMGGLQPGQSTNAVALAAAEAVGAKLVVNLLSGVAGVYRRFPPGDGEKPLECISLDELADIVREAEQSPGAYKLIDHVALGIARRSGISIVFADGSNPTVIERILRGERLGTIVRPEGCPTRG